MKFTFVLMCSLAIFVMGYLIGHEVCWERSQATERVGQEALSVEHVQRELNEVIDPNITFDLLDVDGVAGKLTVAAWMFYSPGWEAHNQKIRIERYGTE